MGSINEADRDLAEFAGQYFRDPLGFVQTCSVGQGVELLTLHGQQHPDGAELVDLFPGESSLFSFVSLSVSLPSHFPDDGINGSP